MEKLALTCRVLYDKDWLDNIKLCKDRQLKPVIKYKSIHDWMRKMNEFQVSLKRFLDEQFDNEDIFKNNYILFVSQYWPRSIYSVTKN